MEQWEYRQERGFQLTKDMDGEIFHVQVCGPAHEEDSISIQFLDGRLKGCIAKVDCDDIQE